MLPWEVVRATIRGDVAFLQNHYEKTNDDIDDVEQAGCGLLWRAAYNNQDEVIRWLLRRGANVGIRTVTDKTPLHAAAQRYFTSTICILLEASAEIDAVDAQGKTPLMEAASGPQGIYGQRPWATVRLLLRRGARLCDEAVACSPPLKKLLADARRLGEGRYVREPRMRLLTLRVLASQGRAKAGAKLRYLQLFAGDLPEPLFRHILQYWW